jgi:hypothetical protein
MTFLWFVIWLVANTVGAHEPLTIDPVNTWTATLILAVASTSAGPAGCPGERSEGARAGPLTALSSP